MERERRHLEPCANEVRCVRAPDRSGAWIGRASPGLRERAR